MLLRVKHGSYSKSTHNLIKKMMALPGNCWRIKCHCEWASGEVWELGTGEDQQSLRVLDCIGKEEDWLSDRMGWPSAVVDIVYEIHRVREEHERFLQEISHFLLDSNG